jgi:hypothetical protein
MTAGSVVPGRGVLPDPSAARGMTDEPGGARNEAARDHLKPTIEILRDLRVGKDAGFRLESMPRKSSFVQCLIRSASWI